MAGAQFYNQGTVKMVGAHPPAPKGKYVEVTVPQWTAMFKIVRSTQGNQANRVGRAQDHHNALQIATPTTHPNFLILAAMQNEETSIGMKSRTNTAFDVRGWPLAPGDVVRGALWPDTDILMHLRVSGKDLSETPMLAGDPTDATVLQDSSISTAQWHILEKKGFWQPTTVVDKLCARVVGHIRVAPDDDGTKLAFEDPFFTVVHLLEGAANPEIAQPNMPGDMLLLPRHASGQPYLVKSDLTATAAIETMRRYADKHSKMIMVRGFVLCGGV